MRLDDTQTYYVSVDPASETCMDFPTRLTNHRAFILGGLRCRECKSCWTETLCLEEVEVRHYPEISELSVAQARGDPLRFER